MNLKKKLLMCVGLSTLLSCSLNAAPPEFLSVEDARNMIHGRAILPDSEGTDWVLDTAMQGSGWRFDADKALTVLARQGAQVTRGGMYQEGNKRVSYLIKSDQTTPGIEGMSEALYEILFKQAGVVDDGEEINKMLFGKAE